MLIGNPAVELPEPPLASGPLLLRPWEEADVRPLVEACADPLTARYTSVPIPYTPEDARRFISFGRSPTALPLAVVSAGDDSEILGAVGLHAVSLTRQGVAQAALELLSEWALGPLGLERLDLYVEPENETSQRVAERAGYKRGALVRSGIALRGRRYDVVRFTLLR